MDITTTLDSLPPTKWADILHDCRHEPLLIDHYAGKVFPSDPQGRIEFRKRIRRELSSPLDSGE
mgnify:FL=1